MELSQQYDKKDVLDVPILTASLDDPSSLDSISEQTKVIISTAGPFAQIGTPVVESAVRSKTHYCDITGKRAGRSNVVILSQQTFALLRIYKQQLKSLINEQYIYYHKL